MTALPREGDRVRVIYEGVVTGEDRLRRGFNLDHLSPLHRAECAVSVEVLSRRGFRVGDVIQDSEYLRLPRGAVVADEAGHAAFRAADGYVFAGGHAMSPDDVFSPRTLVHLPPSN